MKDRQLLGMIGVVISALAWLAVSADHFPFVYRIVTPEFHDARKAYDILRQRNAILRKGDQGFSQISATLKMLVGNDPALELTQIRTLGSGLDGVAQHEEPRWVSHLSFEISFLNFPQEIWKVGGLEEVIKKRYLSLNLFLWGSIVFGTGLILSLIAVSIRE
jgi:hypothetical protein